DTADVRGQRMSVFGQKQTGQLQVLMSALPRKADIDGLERPAQRFSRVNMSPSSSRCRWSSHAQGRAGTSMRFSPADKSKRLRNRVDLVVVTDAGKSEQLKHEFAQPCRVLGEVN